MPLHLVLSKKINKFQYVEQIKTAPVVGAVFIYVTQE